MSYMFYASTLEPTPEAPQDFEPTTIEPIRETPQDFSSLLTSLSITNGKRLAAPPEGARRPSTFAAPSSAVIPEKLPTYTESEAARGTKRKAELPAQKPRPDSQNPLFDARLDLKHAAGLIYKTVKTAHTGSSNWADVMVESHFLQFAEKGKHNPDHALRRTGKDFGHILELVRYGRKGWDLTDLPHNFFEDVEQLLPDIVMNLKKVSEYRGCGWLLDKVIVPVTETEKKLKAIHKERDP